MGEVLDDHNWNTPGKKRQAYPWDDWTDGRIWKIVRGEDFLVKFTSMQSQLRNKFIHKRPEMSVRVNMFAEEGYIIFQYYIREEWKGDNE